VEYLARCRSTLALGPTTVMTPMQFVVGLENRSDADVWLFSAGADNPDIVAAFEAAIASRAGTIRLVTVNAGGALAVAAGARPDTEVIVLPVADPKDGFLATHSMVSMVCGLLLAAGRLAGTSKEALATTLSAHAIEALSAMGAGRIAADGFRSGDTIVLLHDPQLTPVAILLETCLWETGLAPVQRTDFRNFAHGRHVWAARSSWR
jgi:fructoselysine-6-P-deglycase FrlB-like protein